MDARTILIRELRLKGNSTPELHVDAVEYDARRKAAAEIQAELDSTGKAAHKAGLKRALEILVGK